MEYTSDGLRVIENTEHYLLCVDEEVEYDDGNSLYVGIYRIINRSTGITEHQCVSLPEGMYTLAAMESALTNRPWEWVSKRGEDTARARQTNLDLN